MREAELIARLLAGTLGDPAALGLRDDGARLALPIDGAELLISTDAVAMGVHCLEDDSPEVVAGKLVRVNLSDIAALAGVPRGMLLAGVFDTGLGAAWARAFADAIVANAKAFAVPLLGGDIVARAGLGVFTLTILGVGSQAGAARRDGARAGDDLWVSGTLGDAAAGLALCRGEAAGLSDSDQAYLVDRYRAPTPRLALGQAVAGLASAMVDTSDGLMGAMEALAQASGLTIHADYAKTPLSGAARRFGVAPAQVCASDDYELMLTAPQAARTALAQAARKTQTPICRIGMAKQGAPQAQITGTDANLSGYQNFWTPFASTPRQG